MTETTMKEERGLCGSASSGTKRRAEVKRPCDSCPMPIVFPVRRSCKVTELWEKVSTQ